MKKFLFVIAAVALFSCNTAKKESTVVVEEIVIETPEQAINALIEGNLRFMNDSTIDIHDGMERVVSLVDGQSPFACVIGCSDSRVPAELIFDQGFGDLFVIRNAGNTVLDDSAAGSVEYAAEHLGVKAIVVLGHTFCGAITAIVESDAHAHADGSHHNHGKSALNSMLEMIEAKLPVNADMTLDEAIIANVNNQVAAIMALEPVAKLVESKELVVIPAIYDITTGSVAFLD